MAQRPSDPPGDDSGRLDDADLNRNHLAAATSPYLLQHRDNPVHWHPWGETAFAWARQRDVPIFLSVGYATCYWCHVMERESFESAAVAEVLNRDYVSIKVDREERPDVDEAFMRAVQLLNRGQGGWPMSVWIDPHTGFPFIAGTYFPPEDAMGRPGFVSALRQIHEMWTTRRGPVQEQAAQLAEVIADDLAAPARPGPVPDDLDEQAIDLLLRSVDSVHGGFGRGPAKFPMAVHLELLVELAWDRPAVRGAVRRTLDRMAAGGLHDHVGGGFHRYTVDAEWCVPHFEKMLYDQAQLLPIYAEVAARTGDAADAEVARDLVAWLDAVLSVGPAYASATDAEVDGREGDPFVWTEATARAALTDADDEAWTDSAIDEALATLGLADGPNFRDPHDPAAPPSIVVSRPRWIEAVGARVLAAVASEPSAVDRPASGDGDGGGDGVGSGADAPASAAAPASAPTSAPAPAFDGECRPDLRRRALDRLRAARARRPQPRRDHSVIAGWNGLMVDGLARAGHRLGVPAWIDRAAEVASFLLDAMRTEDGTVARAWREDAIRADGRLEDQAGVALGLLTLHDVSSDGVAAAPRPAEGSWLAAAESLVDAAIARFRDPVTDRWFDGPADTGPLFVRGGSAVDGAVPSGMGLMTLVLVRLGIAAGRDDLLDLAVRDLAGRADALAQEPTASTVSVRAWHRLRAERPSRVAALADQRPSAVVRQPGLELRLDPARVPLPGAGDRVDLEIHLVPAAGHRVLLGGPEPESTALSVRVSPGDGLEATVVPPAGTVEDTPVGRQHVLREPAAIRITLERTGDLPDRLRFDVRSQTCGDTACQLPATARLTLEIARA